MSLPISVFIITKNEEERLPFALKSIRDWVDEIVVVDCGSNDATVEVAQELGADKVIYHKWQGYGPQKVYAEKQCKNKWLLNLDADEEVSAELKKEITNLFLQGEPECSAYSIPIRTWSRFKQKVPTFAPSNTVVRLYNRSQAGFAESVIHDSVKIKGGSLGRLRHHLIHRCFKSYSHALEKINFYTSMQAEDLFNKGRNPAAIRILIEPFFAFFKGYILDRYIFLGLEGVIEALIYSFGRTLRLAKAREKFVNRSLK